MDWLKFFSDNSIEYVTVGPNTKSGEASIACPFCGDDPSFHMGVHLTLEKWSCWRNITSHSGRRPHRLIRELLGCSHNHAGLVVRQYSRPDPNTLEEVLAALADTEPLPAGKVVAPTALEFPPDFRPIVNARSTRYFWEYLAVNRGFGDDTTEVIKEYGLLCASSGKYKQRIIIPAYSEGRLVGWTARAVVETVDAPRYLTLSEKDGALCNIKEVVLWEDELLNDRDADLLFVAEGPLDGMKLDYYGFRYGARATCTFSTHITFSQVEVLRRIAKRYKRKVILFDPEAVGESFKAADLLPGFEIGSIANGIEDPGAMTPKQVRAMCRQYGD